MSRLRPRPVLAAQNVGPDSLTVPQVVQVRGRGFGEYDLRDSGAVGAWRSGVFVAAQWLRFCSRSLILRCRGPRVLHGPLPTAGPGATTFERRVGLCQPLGDPCRPPVACFFLIALTLQVWLLLRGSQDLEREVCFFDKTSRALARGAQSS